jgi:hypothetical protein
MGYKLTNRQLELITDKIYLKVREQIEKYNKEVMDSFEIDHTSEHWGVYLDFMEYTSLMKKANALWKDICEETEWSTYSKEPEVGRFVQFLKRKALEGKLAEVSKPDIEFEVITNQNKDISELVNSITEKLLEKKLIN